MRYFLTSNPALVSRQFDDEIVIANYVTGAYYSLMGSAAEIWLGLRAGASVEDIATRLSASGGDVAAAVDAFVVQLGNEGIILPAEAPPQQMPWSPSPGLVFSPPLLERFDDLKDLLLLDPVHDVDEAGWPLKADGES